MEWWNYSWCQGMSFYALSKRNKTKMFVTGSTYIRSTMLTVRTVPSSRAWASRHGLGQKGLLECSRITHLILRIKKMKLIFKATRVSERYVSRENVPKDLKKSFQVRTSLYPWKWNLTAVWKGEEIFLNFVWLKKKKKKKLVRFTDLGVRIAVGFSP